MLRVYIYVYVPFPQAFPCRPFFQIIVYRPSNTNIPTSPSTTAPSHASNPPSQNPST